MATITLKAGMVWKGAYDASVTYDKLDVVYNADKTQIAVCKQGGTGIPLTNSNYWEVSIDASGIIALLEDALAHGEIYTMKIGSVTTGATSSATIVNNHQTHETILNLVLEKGEKGDKGDKGDRGEKGDTVILGDGENYTLYNQTGNHSDGAMTQDAVTKEFGKLDETYARNDGYYESMGVGMATNLKGQNVVDAEFAYRKSGGNVEVQDGNAMIEAIKGNTIAWNQLVKNGDFHDGTTGWSIGYGGFGTISANNNILTLTPSQNKSSWQSGLLLTQTIPFVTNHKYYVQCFMKPTSAYSNILMSLNAGYASFGQVSAGVWNKVNGIATLTDASKAKLSIYNSPGFIANETIEFKNLMLFDLTLIYDSGNEPSTPEQFEQDYFNWFGKPLTYEPYDAGSLRNTKVSALKTTGFNLWDEEWVLGRYNPSNGQVISDKRIRAINDIRVMPLTNYYINKPLIVIFKDSSHSFISSNVTSGVITTPANCQYITFSTADDSYGNTYNHDICINLSDPNRNGEYEPYKESTLPLDITTLTGKLNGEGSSVVVFPNGMEQGDEITIADGVVKAIRRRKVVDLSSPDWYYDSNLVVFRTTLNQPTVSSVPNLVCSKYAIGTNKDSGGWAEAENKTIFRGLNSSDIIVKDTSYSGVTAFKNAIVGEKLCYELAEPEVYVLDDFNLPKLYPVANGGTEEQLSNSSNSLPATLSIRYGLNAAAFIQNAPKNYISKESMSTFLGNLGSAMGGSWTMVWNSSTNKYDFSFTQNRSADVEQPIEDK